GDGAVLHIGRVGVPGEADLGMAAVLHDGLHVLRLLGAAAVDLDPDFDPGVLGRLTAGDERLADLFEGLLDRHAPGQAVGPHFDATTAEVGDQLHELLARLDLPLDLGLIRRLEFAGRAATPDFDLGIGALLADFLALRLAQRRLDAVLVR